MVHKGVVGRKLAATDGAMMDVGWTLLGGILVFFMQAGFSLLEAGFVRKKSSQSVLIKNVIDIGCGAVGWFLIGYGLAFGEDNKDATDGGGIMGTSKFWCNHDVLNKDNEDSAWFFQFTFCATAATIVSGSMAERCKIEGYSIFSLLMSMIFYPLVVHWTWGGGFLAEEGYNDFAGSGIVHMFGGVAALVGAIILGPRQGRFTIKDTASYQQEFAPSSVLHVTLGTFILWFGWFGFNAGSTVALSGGNAYTAARCCTTTTLSAAVSGLVCFGVSSFRQKRYDILGFTNGALGGLVGITAGCATIDPQIACFVGFVSAFIVEGASALLLMLGIDDPVGAFPVHGACGIWGVIAVGLFDMSSGALSGEDDVDGCFGANLLGIVVISIWAIVSTGPVFLGLKMVGLLRISKEVEALGIDSEFNLGRISLKDTNKAGGGAVEAALTEA